MKQLFRQKGIDYIGIRYREYLFVLLARATMGLLSVLLPKIADSNGLPTEAFKRFATKNRGFSGEL